MTDDQKNFIIVANTKFINGLAIGDVELNTLIKFYENLCSEIDILGEKFSLFNSELRRRLNNLIAFKDARKW